MIRCVFSTDGWYLEGCASLNCEIKSPTVERDIRPIQWFFVWIKLLFIWNLNAFLLLLLIHPFFWEATAFLSNFFDDVSDEVSGRHDIFVGSSKMNYRKGNPCTINHSMVTTFPAGTTTTGGGDSGCRSSPLREAFFCLYVVEFI